MPQRTDTYDLARLGLTPGEGRRLDLHVHVDPFDYGGSRYAVPEELVPVRLDISRTTGDGWALRLRFSAAVDGPCMRCLEPATPTFDVDSYEVHQPGAGDEDLTSPYMDEHGLDLEAWARDALALALPAQIKCRPDCAGLCAKCGANLNEDPGHEHEPEPDVRWAKLSELKFD
jgi:uncharacterized protein